MGEQGEAQDPTNPKLATAGNDPRWLRTLRASWITIMFLSAMALLAKIIFAFLGASDAASFWYVALRASAILVVLYVLFLTEGMLIAASQIRIHDSGKINEFIKDRFNSHIFKLSSIVVKFINNYEQFVVGRQFISIAAVVGLVFLVSSMNDLSTVTSLDYIGFLPQAWSTEILYILNRDAAIFIISTLLPCWICQLLPHFMVESSTIGFLKFPLSGIFADVCVRISKLEAGSPTIWMLEKIKSRGYFTHPERISAGDEAIFSTAAAYQGYCITKRKITLTALEAATVIDDHCVYEFQAGDTQNLQHSVKVTMSPEVKLIGWRYEYPVGLRRAKEIQAAFSMSISTAGVGSSSMNVDAPVMDMLTNHGDTGNNSQHITVTESTILEEYLFLTTIPFHVPLPRRAGVPDTIGVSVTYQVDPLNLKNQTEDTLFFEIGKPTGTLIVEIQQAPGTFIRPPKIGLQPAEELPYFGQPRTLNADRAPRTETANGWKIEVPYPPVGARIVLGLDAMPDPNG